MVEYNDFGATLSEEVEVDLDRYLDKKIVEYIESDTKCEAISKLSGPVEALVPPDKLDVISELDNHDREFMRKNFEGLKSNLRDGEVLLVHETEKDKAEDILLSGFSINRKRDVDLGSGIRNKSIYLWLHDRDIGEHVGDGVQIIAKTHHSNVLVSTYLNFTFLEEGLITREEYEDNHLFELVEYLECLKRGFNPKGYHLKNLIGLDENIVPGI